MNENNSVQLHLTPAAGTSTTITTNPDGTVTVLTTSLDDQATRSPDRVRFLPAVEDLISRHEKNGFKGTRSREMATELVRRGWDPKAGPSYIRYLYFGDTHKITLYANSRDIMIREYRTTVDEWPNAVIEKNETRWRYNEDNFQAALETIGRLEAFANGKDV